MLGTRFIAGPLMRRIGVPATAATFFAILSVAMLGSFLVQVDSPLWVPIAYITVYNVLTVAASITVTSGVLASDPDVPADQLAAYRGSGVALGGVLAVVVMNTVVFGLARLFMSADFQANGLSQEDAASLMGEIEFRDVCFAYDGGKPVLQDINLHVAPGLGNAIGAIYSALKNNSIN